MSCEVNCTDYKLSPSNDTSTEAEANINPELSPESVVILSIISALASTSGSIGNSLVMLAVFKSENLRSIPDFIISSLAFSDFTVCSIYLPFLIYEVIKQNPALNIARKFFGHCSLTASVTNMFVVTVDRVIAIRFPLKYPAIMTVKTVTSVISLVWLISLIFGAVYATEMGISRFILLSYCIILMLCTMSMYAYIFYAAKRQENKVQTLNFSAQPDVSAEQHKQQKAEKKAAKTIFTVVGIYALCWLPLLLLPIFVNPFKTPVLFKTRFYWVQTVLSCNSALNPFVYCIRSEKYRKQFVKLLRIKRSERTNRGANFDSNALDR